MEKLEKIKEYKELQKKILVEIELLKTEESEPDKFLLESEERIEYSLIYKQKATDFFKKGELKNSLNNFENHSPL